MLFTSYCTAPLSPCKGRLSFNNDDDEGDVDDIVILVCYGDDHEYKLIRDLLRNYDPRLRPLMNASHALNVTFGVALSQIIDVVSNFLLLCFYANVTTLRIAI